MRLVEQNTLKFNRNKTNLVLVNAIKSMILSGDSRLKDPVKNKNLSMLSILDSIKSQSCVRIINYSPDENNKHLKTVSLGPSYLEQQVSRAIDKAVENKTIPVSYVSYIRHEIGLNKETQPKRRKSKKPIKEQVEKDLEIQDLPGVKVSIDMPALRQSEHYSCGATAIQMISAFYGDNIRESDLIDMLGVKSNSGVKLSKLEEIAKKLKFVTKRKTLPYKNMVSMASRKIPQIVAIKKEDADYHHFVVIVGSYDNGIVFRDPAKLEYGYLPKNEFKDRCFGSNNKFLSLAVASYKKPDFSSDGVSKS